MEILEKEKEQLRALIQKAEHIDKLIAHKELTDDEKQRYQFMSKQIWNARSSDFLKEALSHFVERWTQLLSK